MTQRHEVINAKSVNSLCLGFLALLIPLVGHIDSWLLAVAAVSALWTWWRYQRQAGPLRGAVRYGAVAVLIGIFAVTQWGRFTVDTAAAFFVLTVAFKWQEFERKRDYFILFLILCYLAAVAFLFERDLIWSLLVIAGVVLLFVGLQRLLAGRSVPLAWRDIGGLLLKVVPLVVVLFVFFPRMGPLWSVPLVSERARTGLSDRMTPGDISELAQNGERVFRVTFGGEVPLKSTLYWRALILDRFDGQTWRQTSRGKGPWRSLGPVNTSAGVGELGAREYEILMDPSFERWGFNLQNARATTTNVRVTEDDLVRFPRPVDTPVRYRLTVAGQDAERGLGHAARRFYTQLPTRGNPRTRQWVHQQIDKGATAKSLIETVAQRLRNQAYFYTLNPPLMREDPVDQLLFDKKRGFCAHYASALAFILRTAGIPSRIVTGYQGGESGLDNAYLIVRQYDAHAWVEAYFEGAGWVRFDPTAWIAPERVEQGLDAALQGQQGEDAPLWSDPRQYRNLAAIRWLTLRLDAMNYYWNRWVAGYQGEDQKSLLGMLPGKADLQSLALWTAGIFAGFVALFTFVTLWRGRRRPRGVEFKLYARWIKGLRQLGVSPKPGDTPLTLAEKAGSLYPEQATALRGYAERLNDLLYRPGSERDLKRLETQLRVLMRYTRRSQQHSREVNHGR
ncbi:DUF3488 and transglutaminase-like domain-containing protein [Marinobacteraceae bacterium S3BR75-40.1]